MTYAECKRDFDRRYSFRSINHTWELAATLRSGPSAWPGGYPLFFVTADGAALSFASVRANYREVLEAIRDRDSRSGWMVIACDVNWEDASLYCDHSRERIESAYAEDEASEV